VDPRELRQRPVQEPPEVRPAWASNWG
jgi:hypothetical protein